MLSSTQYSVLRYGWSGFSKNGLVAAGQRLVGKREVVKTVGTCFGSEIHVEARLRQHLKRMQGFRRRALSLSRRDRSRRGSC